MDVDSDMSSGETPGETREGPGETLQAARLAMEISCREVAEALNLPIKTVEAIEANDYERLPSPVFTRGYIRAYAKLLELDSDPVVARFPLGETETQTAEVTVTPSANGLEALVRQNPRQLMGIAGALALVVLIALVVWLVPESEEAPEVSAAVSAEVVTDEPAAESVATVARPSGPEPVADAAAETRSRVEPTVAAAPAAVPESDIEDDQVAAERSVVVDAAPATTERPLAVAPASDSPATEQPAPDTPVGVRRITATGSDRLLFQFTDDCWVEIKSATGASLYSDLSRAGRTLELVGLAPFRILLGYAPGVTMSFNDEAVALAPHTRNNVANLVLGQ